MLEGSGKNCKKQSKTKQKILSAYLVSFYLIYPELFLFLQDPFLKIQIEADLPTGVDWVKHVLSNKRALSTAEQKQNVSASSTYIEIGHKLRKISFINSLQKGAPV